MLQQVATVGMLAFDDEPVEEAAKVIHDRHLSPECVHDDDQDCLEIAYSVIQTYHGWLADRRYVILPTKTAGQRPSTLRRTLDLLTKAGFNDATIAEIEDVVDFLVGVGWDGKTSAVAALKEYCAKEVK